MVYIITLMKIFDFKLIQTKSIILHATFFLIIYLLEPIKLD